VALVAVEPHTQEEVRGVLHRGERIAKRLVVRGGGVLAVGSGGREDLTGEGVVGRVGGDMAGDPGPQAGRPFRPEKLGVHLEQVGPLVRPMLDEGRAAHEPGDELGPLDAGVAPVGEKGLHERWLRRQAGEIERDAAEEVGVGRQRRRLDLHRPPLRRHQFVDRPPRLRLLPDESFPIAHHRERDGGICSLVPHEDRRLATPDGRHQAGGVGRRHLAIAALQERVPRDVAGRAIAEGGHDPELLTPPGHVDHGRRRRHRDRGHPRGARVQRGPLIDPAANRLVGGVVGLGEQAADVRHGGRGLEQHEAVVGARHVHAAAAVLVGERPDVEQVIVAAQGELEAVLALGGPVAGALVAAQPGEHGTDVAHEIDMGGSGRRLHPHPHLGRDRRLTLRIRHPQHRLAVGPRPQQAARADGDDPAVGPRGPRLLEPHAAGEVDPAAVGERTGDDQLGGSERAGEHDFGRLHGQRGHLAWHRCLRLDRGLDRPRQRQHGVARGDRLDGGHGKPPRFLAAGGVEAANHAIRAGHGNLGIARGEGHRIGHPIREGHAAEQFRGGLAERVELRPLRLRALAALLAGFAGHLRHHGQDLLRHVGIEVVGAHDQFAAAVEPSHGGQTPAVGGKPQRRHPPGHGVQRKDQIGVVADLALRVAVDPVGPGCAVRSGRDHVIERGMAIERGETPAEGARRDRGDVVDEPLRGQFGELHRHVAADGNHMVAAG